MALLIRAGPAAPAFSATAYAPEMDSRAASDAAAGRPSVALPRWSRYTEERIAPSAATTSAPPSWRMVLLTAEPTPAFSRGSDAMIDSVADGITLAMPTPIRKNAAPTIQIGVVAPMKSQDARPTATSSRPVVLTAFGPNRLTMAALRGANTIWATANGTNSAPEASGP